MGSIYQKTNKVNQKYNVNNHESVLVIKRKIDLVNIRTHTSYYHLKKHDNQMIFNICYL